MKNSWVSNFTDAHLTLIALSIFVLFFLGLNIWIWRRESTEAYGNLELKPFEDGEAK